MIDIFVGFGILSMLLAVPCFFVALWQVTSKWGGRLIVAAAVLWIGPIWIGAFLFAILSIVKATTH